MNKLKKNTIPRRCYPSREESTASAVVWRLIIPMRLNKSGDIIPTDFHTRENCQKFSVRIGQLNTKMSRVIVKNLPNKVRVFRITSSDSV